MLDSVFKYLPPVHREGYVFVAIGVLVTLFLFILNSSLGLIGLALTICCAAFFRDPSRMVPKDSSIIVSPADGLVEKIVKSAPPQELESEGITKEMTRVSIFLSVADVHVNRIPINSVVKKLHYNPGKFFNASLDKASKFNERQTILLEADNHPIVLTQIAGLIARRIVCHLDENQRVNMGDRFGIIRFGSRVDLYLPTTIKPLVSEGQYVLGGETIIANLKGTQNTIKRVKV